MKKKKIALAIASLPIITSVFGIPLSLTETESFKQTTSINKNKTALNSFYSSYYAGSWTPDSGFRKTTNFEKGVPTNLEELNKLTDAQIKEVIKANKYDSRNYDIVTPGVNQGGTKLCWAFGTKAGIETSLLKNGIFKYYNDLKLSATNITYVTKIRDGSKADKLGFSAGDSWSYAYNAGGQLWEVMSMMTQWTSPENIGYEDYAEWYDNADEYADPSNIAGVPAQIINLKTSANDEVTNDEIKEAIVKYGSVTVVTDVGYSKGLYSEYINGAKDSTYKHAVTLIGWDNSINKNNYMDGKVDGGWIAKNSGQGGWEKKTWSSEDDDFDDIGTIRVSMDSKFTQAYALDYSAYNKNQSQYYYDGASDQNNSGRSETKLASIFPALNETYDKKEVLKKVFFGVDSGSNYQANIKIYKKNGFMTKPDDGQLVGEFKSNTFKYPGYYTVDVPTQYQNELNSGDYFSVIVELTNGAKLMTSLENSNNDYTMYWDSTKNQWSNLFDKQSGSGRNYVARVRAITETKNKASADTAHKNDLKYAQVTIPGDYFSNNSVYGYKSYNDKPEPKVVINGVTLQKDKDYSVEYNQVLDKTIDTSKINSDNTLVGYETITIKGKGQYSGVNNKTRFNIKVGLTPPGLDKLGTWDRKPSNNSGNPSSWNPVVIKVKPDVKKYGQVALPTGWEWTKNKDDNIQFDTVLDSPIVYKGEDAKYFRKSGTYLKFVTDAVNGASASQTVDTSNTNSTPVVDNTPSVTSAPVETTAPVVDNTPSVDPSPGNSTPNVVDTTPTESTPSVEQAPVVDNKPAGTTPADSTPAVVNTTPTESTSSVTPVADKETKAKELDQFINNNKVEPIKVDNSTTATAELNEISENNVDVYFVLPKDTNNVVVKVSEVKKDNDGNIIVKINFSLKDDPSVSKVQSYTFNSQSFTQSAPTNVANNNTVAIAAGAAAGAVAILAAASIIGFVIYKKKHLKK
ncbi:MAG: hypothetical protein HUJ42_00950 [Malacoplasma sp.]|mgnify:CR=1 FL=1|nr:hypothetical protein [Malacoplasma sp.]